MDFPVSKRFSIPSKNSCRSLSFSAPSSRLKSYREGLLMNDARNLCRVFETLKFRNSQKS